MSWSATQYSLFERQRTRPVQDLLAAVPREGIEQAVDLGHRQQRGHAARGA